jgi:zinc transport system substrate-binding protein
MRVQDVRQRADKAQRLATVPSGMPLRPSLGYSRQKSGAVECYCYVITIELKGTGSSVREFPMRRSLCLALILAAEPVWAEVPAVLTDTAPVHSLVSMVMGDLGSPSLIMPPGTSPHNASLAPSEAQALTEADLIVWTGNAFLPWLGESIASLAPQAQVVSLLESDGWEPLPGRVGADLEGNAEDDHVEGQIDPHAWLDPAVAAAWLSTIAEALAAEDPENADTYRANAAAGAERLTALGEDIAARLAPLAGRGYAVGHEAYQYFERATGLPASGTIAQADGTAPAPRDVASLRDAVMAGEVECLLLDTEISPDWTETLGEGATLQSVQVDPEGALLEPGPELYPTLMENLAAALESCLTPS